VRGLILLSTFAHLPLASGWRARLFMRFWSQVVERMPLLAYGARIAAMPGQFGRWVPVTSMRTYLRGPLASGPDYRHKVDLIAAFDARPWLNEIPCPSLVLVARRDGLIPVQAGRELASGLPASTLRELPCGHLSYLALPATIRTLVEQWRAAMER
jgi:pimeloyl-ACP methyl ester carboxylesterase